MLFSSTTFIFIFLPIVLCIYYCLMGHKKAQNILLCFFSLLFYAWGEPKFVLIMIASIIINWLAGIFVDKFRNQGKVSELIIVLDLIFNLGLLFIFKYLNFTINTINSVLYTDIAISNIALPIGISFFTFQAISYVIDVKRQKGYVQKNILNVALYISFFPQLIAGPIVRYETIANQINNRKESLESFSHGVVRFIIGLGKKCIIANNMALIADFAWQANSGTATWFGEPVAISASLAWLGALAYTFQIFFDFSGYSDMAIGLGKMFGFQFLENFNYPYISKTITEFWRRWHISLGTWFRDYLYIPLGGNRCSTARSYFNLAIVWFCTGLWHGANWTFIIWGIMYMLLLMFERATGLNKDNPRSTSLSNIAKHMYAMLFVVVGWVIFRSDSLPDAMHYLHSMISFENGNPATEFYLLNNIFYFVVAILASVPLIPWLNKKVRSSKNAFISKAYSILSFAIIVMIFIVSISFIVKGSYNPFIYFNF